MDSNDRGVRSEQMRYIAEKRHMKMMAGGVLFLYGFCAVSVLVIIATFVWADPEFVPIYKGSPWAVLYRNWFIGVPGLVGLFFGARLIKRNFG